jgi:hypothetical protein
MVILSQQRRVCRSCSFAITLPWPSSWPLWCQNESSRPGKSLFVAGRVWLASFWKVQDRTALPEGPDVELYTVKPESTAAKLEEIVTRWVNDGFCQVDEILILSPHGTKVKTSLSGCSQIREWPLVSCVIRKPGELSLLSINKAKDWIHSRSL